jgi:hypothetical protein
LATTLGRVLLLLVAMDRFEIAEALRLRKEADVWGLHVSEWRGNNTKHVCTNTV